MLIDGMGAARTVTLPGTIKRQPGPWRSGYVLPKAKARKTPAKKGGATTKAAALTTTSAPSPASQPRRWAPWIIGALVLIAGVWYVTGRGRRRSRRPLYA